MEADLRVMDDLYKQIEKGRVNFKKSPKDRITESYIMARLEALENLIKNFCGRHEKIVSSYSFDVLQASSYVKNDVYDNGYELYLVYKSELNDILMEYKSPKINVSDLHSIKNDSIVRLPKISLPVFTGQYAEWPSFRDLFSSLIINNPSLDDVQRLHYLKTQVKGEAEQLIKHIPITLTNFSKCWGMLKNRYNNKRYVSNCVLKRLFSQRSMNCESSQALKDLLDTTSDCIHELSNLGVEVKHWDIIIIYIVSSKLDTETRKQWELHVNYSCDDLPSYTQFKEFIESRFRALEFVEPTKMKSNKSNIYSPNTKVMHVTSEVTCPHCNDNHKLYYCSKFSQEDVANRHEIVKSLSLCFNCLGKNHSGKVCRVPTNCRICKGRHHTLLHGKPSDLTVALATETPENVIDQPDTSFTTDETDIKSHLMTGKVLNQTLLATALVKAESKNGHPQIIRALLDQGSQASFISEASVQLLQLKKIATKCNISGLGGKKSDLTSKYVVMVNIQSLYDPSFKVQVTAHVLNTVTSILPENKFIVPNWTELGRLQLADPQYNSPNKVDILLGSEVYCKILKEGFIRSPSGSTIAQDTYLGWVLSGRVSGNYEGKVQGYHNVVLNLHIMSTEENELLKKFWELESEPNTIANGNLTPEEQACENHYNTTTYRNAEGQYIVELPFRQNILRDYGDTRSIAVKRLLSLEKRLAKNIDLKQDYTQVIKEYVQLDHMELVKNESDDFDSKVWLPHHAVIRKDKSTTKTRVVFNASDRSANGLSLNDTLMVGPKLQPELRHTIMRWRLQPICLIADIVKMYRQVKVADKHTDYQRIVWRSDIKSQIENYRLLTVTFGTSCAPYLAVKCLQQVAIDEGHNYPLAASRVKTDFYMDDLMTGCDTEQEAVMIYKEMNELLSKCGFTLQKWACNKIGLLESLEENSEAKREFNEDDVTKVVGLTWNRCTDEFDYSVNLASKSSPSDTKRTVIAEICRLYDPLGWISPCIVTAKIFIQKLWITGLDWDDKLPESLLREWQLYRDELVELKQFRIPRWVNKEAADVTVELHGFSDASSSAYAAVVYIRCISKTGHISTHLVTAKTKVAPIKQVSIPRLELCGAVLVSKLLDEVAAILNIPKGNLHAWTDSTVVLAWLSDHPSRWKTFVANRVSEILGILDSSQWSYVRSKENPADCASRGLKPSELINNLLWKHGPSWLKDDCVVYGKPRSIYNKTDLEMKPVKVHTMTQNDNDNFDICSQYSSLRKLIRIIAFCRRYIHVKLLKKQYPSYLTVFEYQEATMCCVRLHQSTYFQEEITKLRNNQNLNVKSKLSPLNPFLDENGILRVGGRLNNSNLPFSTKHPMIIFGDSHLANLLIDDAHEKTMHGGQLLTCNYVRSKYWITNLKKKVRLYIHHCHPCFRNAAKTKTQLMGQLPDCRVIPQKPFLVSGVDYAGPINIRVSKGRGNRSYKGYICLFICMVTKAVHIEAVSDLTSEGFLSAFKRFVARRGRCAHLWSDNGSNFVGASKELKVLFASERSSFSVEVAEALANNGTEWHFIPPYAPNFGGLWEAGIKSTKHHLRRVIGESTLTYEELATVLMQIEACLNSRPLTLPSDDPDDPVPLTPGHFLIGEPLMIAPDHDFCNSKTHILRRWQITQRMVQYFWKRWSQEYLTTLFQRYKWRNKAPELRVGDVVLVKDDNLPPAKWVYGRVVQLHPGKDNVTRVVTLRCKNSQIQRAASKLCPLPVNTQ